MAKWIWAFAMALVLTPALAQAPGNTAQAAENPTCDQRKRVIGHLADKYREAPVAVGVTNSGGLVEVLSSDDGQTWTIIVSTPNGVTCLLATGEGWRTIQSEAKLLGPAA